MLDQDFSYRIELPLVLEIERSTEKAKSISKISKEVMEESRLRLKDLLDVSGDSIDETRLADELELIFRKYSDHTDIAFLQDLGEEFKQTGSIEKNLKRKNDKDLIIIDDQEIKPDDIAADAWKRTKSPDLPEKINIKTNKNCSYYKTSIDFKLDKKVLSTDSSVQTCDVRMLLERYNRWCLHNLLNKDADTSSSGDEFNPGAAYQYSTETLIDLSIMYSNIPLEERFLTYLIVTSEWGNTYLIESSKHTIIANLFTYLIGSKLFNNLNVNKINDVINRYLEYSEKLKTYITKLLFETYFDKGVLGYHKDYFIRPFAREIVINDKSVKFVYNTWTFDVYSFIDSFGNLLTEVKDMISKDDKENLCREIKNFIASYASYHGVKFSRVDLEKMGLEQYEALKNKD